MGYPKITNLIKLGGVDGLPTFPLTPSPLYGKMSKGDNEKTTNRSRKGSKEIREDSE